ATLTFISLDSFEQLLGSGGWRLPIQMPIVFPEVFELHQVSVAIGQSHVDRARHFFAWCDVAWSAGSAPAAMPGDGASSHVIYRRVHWLACVKVGVGPVCLFRPHVNPILVEENRSQRRFLNGRLAGEKLLLPGIAKLGEFPVRIKVAVVSVAAAEHGFLVRSPPHPRAVGITLLVAAGGRRVVH